MRHFNYILDEGRFHKVARRLNYMADQTLKDILEDFSNNLYTHTEIDVCGKKVVLIRPLQEV